MVISERFLKFFVGNRISERFSDFLWGSELLNVSWTSARGSEFLSVFLDFFMGIRISEQIRASADHHCLTVLWAYLTIARSITHLF